MLAADVNIGHAATEAVDTVIDTVEVLEVEVEGLRKTVAAVGCGHSTDLTIDSVAASVQTEGRKLAATDSHSLTAAVLD